MASATPWPGLPIVDSLEKLTAGGWARSGDRGTFDWRDRWILDEVGLEKVRDGSGPVLLFVTGFLTHQQFRQEKRWTDQFLTLYPTGSLYRVHWRAGTVRGLIGTLRAPAFIWAARKVIALLIAIIARQPPFQSSLLTSLVNAARTLGVWKTAVREAEIAGASLARLLACVDNLAPVILVGHSLGARLIQNNALHHNL